MEQNDKTILPPSLMFYRDIATLQSSFNVSMVKAKKLMNRKLASAWEKELGLEQKV